MGPMSAKNAGVALLYAISELGGACFAALAFRVCRPGDFGVATAYQLRLAKILSEFLGTFTLCLTVGLNVLGNSVAATLSIASSLMCMIYALGSVSGAHFNPAVTAAILSSGRGLLSALDAVVYVFAQLMGG